MLCMAGAKVDGTKCAIVSINMNLVHGSVNSMPLHATLVYPESGYETKATNFSPLCCSTF